MTLEEAKEFYFTYHGFGFHMGRDDPYRYKQLQNLNLSQDQYNQWDQEILDDLFERLWQSKEKVWSVHGTIIAKLLSCHFDIEDYLKKLLNEMTKMADLSESNRIMIIENMAGRNNTHWDGGCALIAKHQKLKTELKTVMDAVFAKGAVYTPGRFEDAKKAYKEACSRFNLQM